MQKMNIAVVAVVVHVYRGTACTNNPGNDKFSSMKKNGIAGKGMLRACANLQMTSVASNICGNFAQL